MFLIASIWFHHFLNYSANCCLLICRLICSIHLYLIRLQVRQDLHLLFFCYFLYILCLCFSLPTFLEWVPDPWVELASPALAGGFFTTVPLIKVQHLLNITHINPCVWKPPFEDVWSFPCSDRDTDATWPSPSAGNGAVWNWAQSLHSHLYTHCP